MKEVNVKEARKNISHLLDAVQAGEEVIISRRGKPVARLVGTGVRDREELRFPDRQGFRAKLPPARQSSAALVRDLRDERG